MTTPGVPLQPRAVAAGRGSDWIAEAFEMFRRQPGTWIGILLIWIVLSIAISAIPGLDLVGPFLNPIFSAGMMLGCATQARGERLRVEHLFAAFRSGRLGPLLMLTVWTMLFAIVAVVVMIVVIGLPVLGAFRGLEHPSADELLYAIGPGRLTAAVMMGTALALLLGMATWFAPVLIVLRNVSSIEALKLSFRGCLANWLPLVVYGLLALVILIVAAIPLLLGMLIALPVLTVSIYTAYRDIWPEPGTAA